MRYEQMKQQMVLTTGAILSSLGISRSAMRHYEEIGLVAPERMDGSGYRLYTTADVEHVYECTILKNAGYSVADASALVVGGDLDLDSMVGHCLEESDRQKRWLDTYARAAAHLAHLYGDGAMLVPELCQVERLLCFRNIAESEQASWGRAPASPQSEHLGIVDDKANQALFRLAPVSSRGGVVAGDFFGPQPLDPLDCHVVPANIARAIPELDVEQVAAAQAVGPCTCARISWKCLGAEHSNLDGDRTARTALASFMQAQGLRALPGAFFADCLPMHGGLYVTAYVPVEATGLRGRLALLRSRPRLGALRRAAAPNP